MLTTTLDRKCYVFEKQQQLFTLPWAHWWFVGGGSPWRRQPPAQTRPRRCRSLLVCTYRASVQLIPTYTGGSHSGDKRVCNFWAKGGHVLANHAPEKQDLHAIGSMQQKSRAEKYNHSMQPDKWVSTNYSVLEFLVFPEILIFLDLTPSASQANWLQLFFKKSWNAAHSSSNSLQNWSDSKFVGNANMESEKKLESTFGRSRP